MESIHKDSVNNAERNGTRFLHGIGHCGPLPGGIFMPSGYSDEGFNPPAFPRPVEDEVAQKAPPPPAELPLVEPASTQPSSPVDGNEMSSDRRVAADLVRMVQDFNRALDEAKRSGLIAEPSLSEVKSTFGADGSAGHLLSIKVFRKLC